MRGLIRSKKWPDLWPQDCSAALQNLLLAARAEGLGTVWTGVYPFEERMGNYGDTIPKVSLLSGTP